MDAVRGRARSIVPIVSAGALARSRGGGAAATLELSDADFRELTRD